MHQIPFFNKISPSLIFQRMIYSSRYLDEKQIINQYQSADLFSLL